jgi:hypothetical protein
MRRRTAATTSSGSTAMMTSVVGASTASRARPAFEGEAVDIALELVDLMSEEGSTEGAGHASLTFGLSEA